MSPAEGVGDGQIEFHIILSPPPPPPPPTSSISLPPDSDMRGGAGLALEEALLIFLHIILSFI